MCGRPSVGKLEQSRCNAGWCGHLLANVVMERKADGVGLLVIA